MQMGKSDIITPLQAVRDCITASREIPTPRIARTPELLHKSSRIKTRSMKHIPIKGGKVTSNAIWDQRAVTLTLLSIGEE